VTSEFARNVGPFQAFEPLGQATLSAGELEKLLHPRRYDRATHEQAVMRLADAPEARRLFFALWCQKPLWDRFGSSLEDTMSRSDKETIWECTDLLWEQALGGAKADVKERVLAALHQNPEEVDEDTYRNEEQTRIAELFIETANQTNLTRAAVSSATLLLGALDSVGWHRGFDHGVWASVLAEVDRQLVLIDLLLEQDPDDDMIERPSPFDT
jgi:hypothetical protein